MSKSRVTRRQLLAGAAPVVAAVPFARFGLPGGDNGDPLAVHRGHAGPVGHAAMIGSQAPAPGGPHDLDALLRPPPALPHRPGRVREYSIHAVDREIEVAQGVTFAGWTYNGTIPGPVLRATVDDVLRVTFTNGG